MKKAFVSIIAVLAVVFMAERAEAGLWDTIKGWFGKGKTEEVAKELPKSEEAAKPAEAPKAEEAKPAPAAAKTCTDGAIESGVWTGIKDDPSTKEDETNQIQYIDLNVKQKDGTLCRLSLEYVVSEDKFYITEEPMDLSKETVLLNIGKGEFKILGAGKASVKFEASDGQIYEELLTQVPDQKPVQQ